MKPSPLVLGVSLGGGSKSEMRPSQCEPSVCIMLRVGYHTSLGNAGQFHTLQSVKQRSLSVSFGLSIFRSRAVSPRNRSAHPVNTLAMFRPAFSSARIAASSEYKMNASPPAIPGNASKAKLSMADVR
jgi:hypothetical protein